MNSPDTAIYIALNEEGYLEKSRKAYQINKNIIYDKINGAGSDNITKYGYEMHQIYPVTMDEFSYWCDSFVDWCFYQSYGVATAKSLLGGGFDDYTVASADMYVKHMAFITGSKNFLPGDQIFFKNSNRICHTGIIYNVNKYGIDTIEGNTSNKGILVRNGGCVAKKHYPHNYKNIAGVGRPKYDVPATTRPGDCNKNVVKLQERLMLKGFALPKYGADGDFGSETLLAVKEFQNSINRRTSGVVDANTWLALL